VTYEEGTVSVNEIPEFGVSSAGLGGRAYSVRVEGELDLYTAPDVRDALASLPPESRHVLVDLSQLSFLDSAGLGMLLSAARRLRARGGTMMLLVDDSRILRVLEVTGLAGDFDIRRDREAAVRELVGLSLIEELAKPS
jgi:anti-sigma B factor antagonist